MKNIILNFIKKPFINNIIILTSSTVMAQIINMLFSPLITRIYGPVAYGLMGTFTSIVQILAPIAAFSYPIASVLPKNNNDAKILLKLSFYITVINTIITFIAILLFNNTIVDLFNLVSIESYIYFIPIILLSSGILQIYHQWLIRNKQFQVSARANLAEVLIVNCGKLFFGLINPAASILVFFTALRKGIRAFFMHLFSGKKNLKNSIFISSNDGESIKNLAIKYKDFPLYRTPEVFLSAVTANVPILLLTTFFGPAAVGFYSIARTVLSIPSQLIGKSVGDVFYPQVSEAASNNKKITPLVMKATLYLGILAVIPFGFVFLFGPGLFSLVFGEEWLIAGEYARWISMWCFFTFINKPVVQTLPVISAQKFQFIFTLVKLIFTSLGLFIGFYIFNNDIVAIALYAIIGAILYTLLILITIFKSKKFDKISFNKSL